jgi:hypothetical protein
MKRIYTERSDQHAFFQFLSLVESGAELGSEEKWCNMMSGTYTALAIGIENFAPSVHAED